MATLEDFQGELINPALSEALYDLNQFYSDPTNLANWYGTRYNPETGQLEQVNGDGQTEAEFIAAGGTAEGFKPLIPVAEFTDLQLEAQEKLIEAAATQGKLSDAYAEAIQKGIDGEYAYTPQQQQAVTQVASATQNPALLQDANYVNEYIDPAVQSAIDRAIGSTNASFGAAGTLGSARNAAAASRAATEAALPTLTQAASKEFDAQQAIDKANVDATNRADVFNIDNQNAINAANTATQNQINTNNIANQNAADQFNLNNISNWAGQTSGGQSAATTGANTIGTVGQMDQDMNQMLTNQDVQAWNFNQNLPQQQLWNLAGLGQLANAADVGNIGYDIGSSGGGASSGGFNFNSILSQGLQNVLPNSGGGSGLSGLLGGGIGSVLGGLGLNEGGKVPMKPKVRKPKVIRRK